MRSCYNCVHYGEGIGCEEMIFNLNEACDYHITEEELNERLNNN